MYQRIHNQFGTAGMILSVVAIVLALAGGAVAASGGKGPRGPRGKTGKTGATGPAGIAGTNGTNGKDGAPGTAGAPGADGKNVVTGTEATGTGNCEGLGGATVEVEGTPASKKYVCNGEDGTFEPNGFTQTGAWTVPSSGPSGFPQMTNGSETFVSISFPIQLLVPPSFVVVKSEEDKSAQGCAGVVNEEGNLEGGAVADPGTLCVYLTTYGLFGPLPTITALNPETTEQAGVSTAGVVLKIKCERPEGCLSIKGVWAVTG